MPDTLFASPAPKTVRLPCISLWGPWAYWVAWGLKVIETRTHNRFRGLVGNRIGIHVTKAWDGDATDLARQWMTDDQRDRTDAIDHVGGQLLCTAVVYGQGPLTDIHSRISLIDCGTTARHGLWLCDVRPYPEHASKWVSGKQGIFYVDVPAELLGSEAAHG